MQSIIIIIIFVYVFNIFLKHIFTSYVFNIF